MKEDNNKESLMVYKRRPKQIMDEPNATMAESEEKVLAKSTKPRKGRKTPSKEKADLCFACFTGGDLVSCTMKNCRKAYHPACTCREESFFKDTKNWKCDWHICTNCKKTAHYMCYTCPYSLCQQCVKEVGLVRVRGYKGFCGSCMENVTLIEKNEQNNKEMDQVDFNDRNSWHYLFKEYWFILKRKLLFKPDELTQAKNAFEGSIVLVGKEDAADRLDDGNYNNVSNSGSSVEHLEVRRSKRRNIRGCSNSSTQGSSSTMAKMDDDDQISVPGDMEWACKELLDFLVHVRNGDTSVLSHFDVLSLLIEYIARNNLRDPHKKTQILCDSRLENLFGKAIIGHFEMLRYLRSHLMKMDTQDYIQGGSFNKKPSQIVTGGNCEALGLVADKGEHVRPVTNHDDSADIINHMDCRDHKENSMRTSGWQICKVGERLPQTTF